MEAIESVKYLARLEAVKLKPKEEHELTEGVPYFSLKSTDEHTDVCVHAYQKHDNANRMAFIAEYLTKRVFPFIKDMKGLDGYYSIELHDSYSYLQNTNDYTGCLTWSKRKEDNHVVCIPDVYHLVNYHENLNKFNDTLTWGSKIDKIGFWGTTTGNRVPKLNARINTCLWGLSYPDDTMFKITKVAQMHPGDVLAQIPNFQNIYNAAGLVSPHEMFKYKFLLDIPGNTCSWDRVPLIMQSNSLLFKMPCRDMCFYYPLMHSGTHYVDVDTNTMLNQKNYYLNNPKEAGFIIANANHFAKTFFNDTIANMYLIELFNHCAHLNAA